MAFEFLNCQLLGEFLDLRISLRNAHTQIEALDEQHENKEQENEVHRRICANQVRQGIEDLREKTEDKDKRSKANPENLIFQFHLGAAYFPGNKNQR